MRLYFAVLCFLIYSTPFFSQTIHDINGMVSDDRGSGLPFVNVLLLKQVDSTFVKGSISSDDGQYEFEDVEVGHYIVLSSYVGYQTTYSKPFSLNSDYTVETLIMESGEQLEAVVVQATKPLYQQKIDRMVINVENSIVSAGGTALEVLERSPGVVVNRHAGSISIVGKEGVMVMVNGKINYVPASALVQMLEGMSSDNIESIEIITTPPANLDAEGNAGFINLVLKQRTDLGLNGAYSLSAGYSNAFITSNNVNFNYRNHKLNIFGNYAFSWDGMDQIFKFYKRYEDSEANSITTDTYSDRDATQRNHNVRLGLDYQTNEKTIMGLLLTGYSNKWSMDAVNNTINTENGVTASFVELINDEINLWRHFGANYNVKHNFGEDEFISMDIDYLYYKDDNPTNYFNTFYDENRAIDREELLRTGKVTPIETWVGKLDYNTKLDDKTILEVGVKGTASNFMNDVAVENFESPNWVADPELTNISELNESIIAAYASVDYTINDSWSAKFGLRFEHTNTKLGTNVEGSVVDRQYGQFFPSIYFNKKWNDTLNMNLSYSRRITRPTFNDMAPFVIFFDPTTFASGNPSLQPAISNSFKYNMNYKSYILSFEYNNQDSSIAIYQQIYDEVTDRFIFVSTNQDYTRTLSMTLGLPIKLAAWWRMQNNFNFIHQKVRGYYTDEPIEAQLDNYSFNTINSFKISDSFSGELSAFYRSALLSGTVKYDPVLMVNMGIQKKISDTMGTLRISVNNLFNWIILKGGTSIPEENVFTKNSFDYSVRTFLLTYTRNFGNKKLKSYRQRETGAEEERQRVN
ncbi:outer membrane beta-barrel family protein [Aestuariivivens sediminicola]|uniref:outer membrane beta-barrel family protein n=1 Tax=Aestuariivivens sediminicola TaxID=2913560 RepID=UPI001F568C94|nr:outer membrane beta-barrel family protein [Aestuariivivens sediminicola]